MLPRRPEWVEKTALLAAQFQAISDGENTPRGAGPDAAARQAASDISQSVPQSANLPVDLQGLVDGYAKLLEFTQHVKIRGLMLDPEFCERVEREWSVKTLLSYMISAEKSLKEQASEAHDEAASLLSARGGNN